MAYNSLFEQFYPNANPTFLNYEDTLQNLLSGFEELKPIGYLKPVDILVLYPPRIIRAVIDYKIYNPNKNGIEELLEIVIQFSLNVYSQSYSDISEEVRKLKKYIVKYFPDLLDFEIIQNEDKYTWAAMNPQKTKNKVSVLAPYTELSNEKNILFVVLAHGGTAVGMDFYLRLKDRLPKKEINFYISRLSTRKHLDTQPKLSQIEFQYLRQLSQNSQIIIFDEDSSSGKTRKIAIDYFERVFQKRVFFVTNINSLSEP